MFYLNYNINNLECLIISIIKVIYYNNIVIQSPLIIQHLKAML